MLNEMHKQLALLNKLLTGDGGPKAATPGTSQRELKRAGVRVQEHLVEALQGKQIAVEGGKDASYLLVTEFEGDNLSKLKEEALVVAQQNVMDTDDVEGWAKEYKVKGMGLQEDQEDEAHLQDSQQPGEERQGRQVHCLAGGVQERFRRRRRV